MRHAIPVVLIALVVLLGTACSGSSEPPPFPDAVGPVSLTGDPRAADPCALLDPEVFERAMDDLPSAGDVIGSCRIRGYAADGRVQWAEAAFDHESVTSVSSAEPPESVGSVTVLRPLPETWTCRRIVRLLDGTLITFSGRNPAGTGWVADCQAAERAFRLGVTRLAGQGITYRADWQRGLVLADANACAALGDPAAVLGLVDPPRYDGFGGWRCFVGTPAPGQTVAWLDFALVDSRSTLDDRGQEVELGRTVGHVEGYPGTFGGGCQVLVEWIDTTGARTLQHQIVRVTVETPGPASGACDQAVGIARAAVARLPATG